MDKIKIAQIGIGHNHGSEKMRAARSFPDVFEVVGVCEADPAWMKSRGSLDVYQGLPFMSEEELLDVPGLAAVLIETDVWNLIPTAQRCIDRDLHVHIDKPAGENLAAFEKLLADARRQSLVVQLAYMYRYNNAVQYAREMASSGALGEIFEIDAVMSTEHSRDFRDWLRHFRGGAMYIFGCHLIDLVIGFRGRPDAITPFLGKTRHEGVDVYDNTLAVLEYPNGPSTVRVSSVEVNGYGRRQFVVLGTKGSIEIKPFERPTVVTYAEGGGDIYCDCKRVIELPSMGGRYDELLLDFARCVRGEKENPFGYEHELLVHKATLKASGFEDIA
ncbi:MAG: Gfo/Idh/MocA family oxidoreductase [Kiritimatiellae bacterium]|jgi:predicted dehydrogenase|nr:Gfo/Idh/MocA family oxidoreductase [Kiritimatiellia bacterium]